MADQPITGLPTKTASGVASTDKMLGIDSAEGYQILVRDVAKYILENCNVSTLAGAVQTPKQAIDGLNNNTYQYKGGVSCTANTSLNSYTTPGTYYAVNSMIASSITDKPSTQLFKLVVDTFFGASTTWIYQYFYEYSDYMLVYSRRSTDGGSSWSPWSNISQKAFTSTSQGSSSAASGIDSLKTQGVYYVEGNDLPDGANGHVIVLGMNTVIKQIYMPYRTPGSNDNHLYIRGWNNNAFGKWSKYDGTIIS